MTTATSAHRRPISSVGLVILSLLKISNVAHGELEHSLHVHQEEHGHTAVVASDEDPTLEVEELHAHHHDHSEHVHSEHCDHDHGATVDADGSLDAEKIPKRAVHDHSHAGHDHSHSHSHNHGGRPKPQFTPLMASIRDDDYASFSQLISSDSSTDIINVFQSVYPFTALFFSFAQKKYTYTEELLRKGADARSKHKDGLSAMMLALRTIEDEEIKFKIVNLVVANGGDIESETEELQDAYKKLMQRGEERSVIRNSDGEGGGEEVDTKDEL